MRYFAVSEARKRFKELFDIVDEEGIVTILRKGVFYKVSLCNDQAASQEEYYKSSGFVKVEKWEKK